MNDSIKRISLDLHATSSRETVKVKRGDTGRKIYVSLVDGGVPYHISEGCYAVFTGKKPDGNILFNGCTIEGNVIIYKLTEQTAAVPGLVKCEIKLYGADDQLITSPKFSIMVDDTVYNEGDEIESEGEVEALTALISDATEAISGANTAASNANNVAQELQAARENGEFNGEPGPQGPQGEQGPPGDPGAGVSAEAATLLLTILSEAVYISDQSGNIQKLKEALQASGEEEPDEPVTPDDPVVLKLSTPVIRLETTDDNGSNDDEGETEDGGEDSSDTEENTPAILGVAILGRTILGDYGDNLPKLATPSIYIETVTDSGEEDTGDELTQLATPVIYLETEDDSVDETIVKLATPVIQLVEE